MMDHFEQLIYSKPNASAGERNGMWNRVETLYNPKTNWGDLDFPAEGGAWMAKDCLFTRPFSGIGEALAIPYGFQFFQFQQETPCGHRPDLSTCATKVLALNPVKAYWTSNLLSLWTSMPLSHWCQTLNGRPFSLMS